MRRAWIGAAAVFLAVFTLGGEPAWAQAAGPAPSGATGGGATPARAAPPGPSLSASEASSAKAEALFKEGREAVAKQSWAVAELKFGEAFALNPSYDVATNLGNTQYRLGKLREAAEHLAFALRVWPLSAKLDQRELVTKRVAELRKALATLTIRVNVEGAAVLVDGRSVGRSPLPAEVFVEPGARVIEAKLGGFEDAKRSLDVAKGAAEDVTLTLAALPASGGPKGSEPGEPEKKPPGETKGDEKATGGASKPLIIAGAATSGALISAGVVFAILSNMKADDEAELRAALLAKGHPDCVVSMVASECASIDSSASASDTLHNVAVFSFAVGGALAVGTVIYAVTAPKSANKSTVRAVPVVTANAGWLAITGSW